MRVKRHQSKQTEPRSTDLSCPSQAQGPYKHWRRRNTSTYMDLYTYTLLLTWVEPLNKTICTICTTISLAMQNSSGSQPFFMPYCVCFQIIIQQEIKTDHLKKQNAAFAMYRAHPTFLEKGYKLHMHSFTTKYVSFSNEGRPQVFFLSGSENNEIKRDPASRIQEISASHTDSLVATVRWCLNPDAYHRMSARAL